MFQWANNDRLHSKHLFQNGRKWRVQISRHVNRRCNNPPSIYYSKSASVIRFNTIWSSITCSIFSQVWLYISLGVQLQKQQICNTQVRLWWHERCTVKVCHLNGRHHDRKLNSERIFIFSIDYRASDWKKVGLQLRRPPRPAWILLGGHRQWCLALVPYPITLICAYSRIVALHTF